MFIERVLCHPVMMEGMLFCWKKQSPQGTIGSVKICMLHFSRQTPLVIFANTSSRTHPTLLQSHYQFAQHLAYHNLMQSPPYLSLTLCRRKLKMSHGASLLQTNGNVLWPSWNSITYVIMSIMVMLVVDDYETLCEVVYTVQYISWLVEENQHWIGCDSVQCLPSLCSYHSC